MVRPVRWVANLSTLFTELPLLERPAAAAAAGFAEVEVWWPFEDRPRPAADEVDAVVAAVQGAGVRLTAMNLYGGDAAAGERGVAAHPDRADDFLDALGVAMHLARRTGTRLFNVPFGRRLPTVPDEDQDRAGLMALQHAARAVHELGGSIMIEPMSGMDDYPVSTTARALELIRQVRQDAPAESVGLLLDAYHLLSSGEDPLVALTHAGSDLVHVQVADAPGRGEPGTGRADLVDFVAALGPSGYAGAVALEWIPTAGTTASLERWRQVFGVTSPDRSFVPPAPGRG